MAFEAGLGLNEHYAEAKAYARQAKNTCLSYAAAFGSGGNGLQVIKLQEALGKLYANLDAKKSIPGLAQFAKDQRNDQTYDIVAEFNAMLAAVNAVLVNIRTTLPADGNDYKLILKMVNDVPEWRTFTSGQLTTLVGLLNTAAATINA